MIHPRAAAALLTAVSAAAGCGRGGSDGPVTPDGWRLVWSDDFELAAGAPPDPAKWSFDLGANGWGNRELQAYTDRPENIAHDGAGNLVITARREPWRGSEYTSARINTRGKLEQAFGRFEARLQLPTGRGLWPAFWMLGADFLTATWPACGEIDVMESRGAQPWRSSAAVHGPGYSAGNAIIAGFEAPSGTTLSDAFHDYAVEWEPDQLRFSVDGQVFHTVRSSRLPANARWVFDHPFFLILNLAVGGNFGGPPDATTAFPQSLRAAHVRAYSR